MRRLGQAITWLRDRVDPVAALEAGGGRAPGFEPTSSSYDVQTRPPLCTRPACLPRTCAATSRCMRTVCEQTVSKRRHWQSGARLMDHQQRPDLQLSFRSSEPFGGVLTWTPPACRSLWTVAHPCCRRARPQIITTPRSPSVSVISTPSGRSSGPTCA
jgi:hypothetical protein